MSGGTGGAPPARARAGRNRTGMAGVLLRIELLKAVKRRAFWMALGLFATFNIIGTIVAIRDAQRYPQDPYAPPFALPDSWSDILRETVTVGPFFVAVLTILLFAPEFTWRTGRQNVIDGLSKERLFAGKIMVLAGLVLLFLATPLLIGGGGALFSPSEGGPVLVRPTDLSYMGGYFLVLLLFGSGALMLASLIRASGPALGVLLLYLIVEELLSGLMSRIGEAWQEATAYLPLNVFEDLGNNLVHYPERLAAVNESRAKRGAAPLEFLDVEVLAIAALAYSAIFVLIAFASMRRRDL